VFTFKSEHFIIMAHDASVPSEDILYAAEKYYQRIASDLGYPRTSNFWTWANRVKIFIYADKASYLKGSGQPEWSEGAADYTAKQIISYQGSPHFIESILPHEMAHLILRDFIKFADVEIPSWLDEGVAQWAEYTETRNELQNKAKELLDKNSFLSIQDIFKQHIDYIKPGSKSIHWRRVRDSRDKWGILILSPDVLLNTFYIQSGSLVGFLVETYGSLRFADFCREIRDGRDIVEALLLVYTGSIHSIDELDDKWREYLRN
jgi:hypothetical protein